MTLKGKWTMLHLPFFFMSLLFYFMKSTPGSDLEWPERHPHTLKLDPSGRLPGMYYRQREDGQVEFRYVVNDENEYPGFDGRWRVITETDRRDTLHMGGRVAEWLIFLR
jgi:hypothetical protein